MNPRWFAVYTRSRHEKKAASLLAEKNIEVFLPLRKVLRRWKDRRKEVQLPLFSGYIFVRIGLQQRVSVLRTPGVVAILGDGGNPVEIPEQQIETIRRVVQSEIKYDPYPYLKEGMPVTIIRGPLRGVEGILVAKRKKHLLVLSVDLIQQSTALQVDISDTDASS